MGTERTVRIYGRGFFQIHPDTKPVLRIRIQRAKITHKSEENSSLDFGSARCSLLRDEDFSRSLDVLLEARDK